MQLEDWTKACLHSPFKLGLCTAKNKWAVEAGKQPDS